MFAVSMVSKERISVYFQALTKLTSVFPYPLMNGATSITYGRNCAAFFCTFGEPYFFLLFDQTDRAKSLIGVCVVTKKQITLSGERQSALYFSHLRLDRRYQLRGTANYFYRKIMSLITRHRELNKIGYYYFATMTGRADLMRIKPRDSLLNLFSKDAIFKLYLIPPTRIHALALASLEEAIVSQAEINFSPVDTVYPFQNPIVDLSDVKDVIHYNKRLKIGHLLNTKATGTTYLQYLKQAAHAANEYDYVCFAVDVRRKEIIDHLSQSGIFSETDVTVYSYNQTDYSHTGLIARLGTYHI